MKHTSGSRADKLGLPPGTLVHVGERKVEEVALSLIDYDAENVEERQLDSPEELRSYLDRDTITWLNVSGVHDVGAVAEIGSALGVHPLVLEDAVNTHQRPKAEFYEDHLFVVLRTAQYDADSAELGLEQVSLVLGKNYVVTFHERSEDVFDSVRERIRKRRGRIRRYGADYLAYALLDVLVDHYFVALEGLGGEIEGVEEAVLSDPSPQTAQSIHALRRVMVRLRKAVWPLRELVLAIERSESDLIAPTTEPYLRDVYDHTVQVIDTVETYRDMLSGYLDIHLSSLSNRMNEVMKVLTIIATIFIPLTFVAGIYGMNFTHMPELKWRWAYPGGFWVAIVLIALALLGYFRSKRWL